MNKTLEDRIGKLGMLLTFGYLCFQQIQSFLILLGSREQIALWPLALISQVSGVVFLCFILYYTSIRLPPRDSAAGLMPRLAAIIGTFFMMLIVVLPPEPISPALRVASTVVVIVGTCLSIYCLNQLGRSFSMMASARELKTTGSYGLVRHPLYASELILVAGVVLAHGTVLAVALGAIWLLLQVRRVHYEESILRETFPEYEAYAQRVPMLFPGFRMPAVKATQARPETLPSE